MEGFDRESFALQMQAGRELGEKILDEMRNKQKSMKTRYNKRIWLNGKDSPYTGNLVCFDGNITRNGNTARNMFVSISDCYQSVRIHLTEDDTIEDFIQKLKVLRDGISNFINHLENNKE